MTELYIVDFVNKKLLGKRDLNAELPQPDQTAIEKYNYFCSLIGEGMTSVKIDTKGEGVNLPPHLKKQPMASINWSKKFRIDDFCFDEHGVRGSLSYGGRPHFTDLPWTSVWGLSLADGSKAKEWPEDLPNNLPV